MLAQWNIYRAMESLRCLAALTVQARILAGAHCLDGTRYHRRPNGTPAMTETLAPVLMPLVWIVLDQKR
jgi:hypothetical protein